jgi:hypothetical protein
MISEGLTFRRHIWALRAATIRQSASSVVAVCGVSFIATVPFMPTLHGYFIGDDFGLIHLFWDQPPLHFLSLLSQSWVGTVYGNASDEIRPTIAISYQFDFFRGSGAPEAFHVTNIACHAVNSVIVLLIAREAARLSWVGAFVAGSLFAILPNQAEAVAWISGRADLIPACFYLGAFLAFAIWRNSRRTWIYVASLCMFCLALLSKQYAITMLVTVVLYDVLIEGSLAWREWRSLRGYLPFLAVTIGYLGLRYVLFHNLIREDMFSFGELVTRIPAAQEENLELLLFGRLPLLDLPEPVRTVARGVCLMLIASGLLPALADWRRTGRVRLGTVGWILAYFGPLWWVVTVAPLTVTYLTPRHLYLPSAGAVIMVGVLFDLFRRSGWPWRYLGWTAVLGLGITCASALGTSVSDWATSASLSGKMATDLQREAARAPAGTLVLVGAQPRATLRPVDSAASAARIHPPPGQPWLWPWVMPYAVQPPFTLTQEAERVTYIEPRWVYCCLAEQWYASTERSIGVWSTGTQQSVIVLAWDPSTGELAKASDIDESCVRAVFLADPDTVEQLDRRLADLLERVRLHQDLTCAV